MAVRSKSGKDLRNVLAENLVKAVYEDKYESFLPQSLFSKLITKEVIKEELGLEGQNDTDLIDTDLIDTDLIDTDLIDWIYNDAPKLFATTVQCFQDPESIRNAMRQFKEHRFEGDSNSTTESIDDSRLSSIRFSGEKRNVQTCYKNAFQSNWEPSHREDFSSKRWRYLAEVFKPDQYMYILSKESILPVVWKSAKRGGFSRVQRVEIHKDHWKHDCASDMVAIKSISLKNSNEAKGAKAAWEKEAKALKAIKKLNTPHILQCIAAVEQEHRLFFLFPWADGGDLHDFWRERSPHRRQANMVRDIIRQLYGLAEALHMLHNINSTDGSQSHDARESIRHGDIKPTNILRFLNGQGTTELGLLKIADMGLAKQHVQYTRERNGITSTNYWTVQYMAPEHIQSQPLSRLYDIWSMGCVILDFVVWILYGDQGLEDFSHRVRTSESTRGEASYFSVKQTNNSEKEFVINAEVTLWLDGMLNSDPECKKESAIRDLLRLVKNKLLVVDLPPNHVNPPFLNTSQYMMRYKRIGTHQRVRATSSMLRDQLRQILANIEKVQGHENYLLIAPNLDDLKIVRPGKPKDSLGKQILQIFKKERSEQQKTTSVLEGLQKYPEAEKIHRQALLMEETLGRTHPSTIESLSNLANMLQRQGNNPEAEQIHRQALRLREEVLGEKHPSTLESLSSLAIVLQNQGKYPEAEQIHRRTLRLREEVLGREHPSTLSTANSLVLIHKQWDKAEILDTKDIEVGKAMVSAETADILDSMNSLASILRQQGRWKDTEELYSQIVEINKTVMGEDHSKTLASKLNVATLYKDQDRLEPAEELLNQVIKLASRSLDQQYPIIITAREALISIYHKQGRWELAKTLEGQIPNTVSSTKENVSGRSVTTIQDSGYYSRNTATEKRSREEEIQEEDNEIDDNISNDGTVNSVGYDNSGQHEPDVINQLISDITNELLTDLRPKLDGLLHINTTRSRLLSERLKDFAMKLEQTAKLGNQMNSVVLIRRSRNKIASSLNNEFKNHDPSAFEKGLDDENDKDHESDDSDEWQSSPPTRQGDLEIPDFRKKTNEWLSSTDSTLPEVVQTSPFDVEDSLASQVSEMKSFLTDSPVYKWLLEKIWSVLVLDIGDELNGLRNAIRVGLEGSREKLGYTQQIYKATFEIDCCLGIFLNHQYSAELSIKLGEVLVLVGSEVDAQLATCRDYVSQTWPYSGEELLQLLENMVEMDLKEQTQYFSDNTKLDIIISNSGIIANASGSIPSVSEVGECLSWLGTILRTSEKEGVIAYSIPRIEKLTTTALTFKISFDVIPLKEPYTKNTPNGACWHSLFNNPVIAKGYPIPKRKDEKGLEISLDYMAQLGQAYRATIFNGHLVLKGHIAMFVPVQSFGNSVVWHFLISQDESRMSYLKGEELGIDCVSSKVLDYYHLESVRNFVGWSSIVEIQTGTSKGLYKNIRPANLDESHPGMVVTGFSVTAGKIVNVGINLKRGTYCSPPKLRDPKPYDRIMMGASKDMCVVLFDTRARRGYLLDAARVLLHITCYELTAYYPKLNFDNKFEHAKSDSGPEAPLEALIKESNKDLEISRHNEYSSTDTLDPWETGQERQEEARSRKEVKSKIWCFQDATMAVYYILEHMLDTQRSIRRSEEIKVPVLKGGKLEGYEFMDVVKAAPACRLKVLQLKDSGSGWMNFTRNIEALTLFGEGFGDLIERMEGSNTLCRQWETVPENHDLLVAPISVLQAIFTRFPHELQLIAKRMLLHAPEQLFENCPCENSHKKRLCTRLLANQPKIRKLPLNLKIEDLFRYENGAVIFGKGKLDLPESAGNEAIQNTRQGLPVESHIGSSESPESYQNSNIISEDLESGTNLSSLHLRDIPAVLDSGARTTSSSLRVPSRDGSTRSENPADVSVQEMSRDPEIGELAPEVEELSSDAQQPVVNKRLGDLGLKSPKKIKKRVRVFQRLKRLFQK
ncbi:hypothetical protein BP6252_13117 [Coleophoma cylindrospora]|uniref:Protein kinase domain-containing protein n=1 Tax=Coleophoma cylindrospora TaxID=1849047 RepID=A0A3D8QA43_9HELO|nr:hypothetical protein BP6252_13117 [Coleophoma cylindrospora]